MFSLLTNRVAVAYCGTRFCSIKNPQPSFFSTLGNDAIRILVCLALILLFLSICKKEENRVDIRSGNPPPDLMQLPDGRAVNVINKGRYGPPVYTHCYRNLEIAQCSLADTEYVLRWYASLYAGTMSIWILTSERSPIISLKEIGNPKLNFLKAAQPGT